MPAVFDALQALDEARSDSVVTHFGQLLGCMQSSIDASQAALQAARETCQAFSKVGLRNALMVLNAWM
jgi:hypothetical protein